MSLAFRVGRLMPIDAFFTISPPKTKISIFSQSVLLQACGGQDENDRHRMRLDLGPIYGLPASGRLAAIYLVCY